MVPSSRTPIAYLVLAHHHPNHFARLVRALLAQPEAAVFVHLDRNTDGAPFRAAVRDSRVRFVTPRTPTRWGTFSLVEATLTLLAEAMRHRVAYCCLLSGADYPIRSAAHIERFFVRHQGTEFMNLVRMPNDVVGKPVSRLVRYQLPLEPRGRLAPLAQRLVDHLVHRDYASSLGGLAPYGGSQWWALSAAACRYILDFVDSHPDYVRFFRHVAIPDESFFHTIIGNSPFLAKVQRNLTTLRWPKGAASPAVLDRDDLARLAGVDPLIEDSPYGRGEVLFARKFPDDSADLVRMLER